MKKLILIFTIAALSGSEISTDIYAPISCYHYKRKGQNEINPGIGVGLSWKEGYVAALGYKDSWNKTGQFYSIGYRKEFGCGFGADIGAGYLKGSKIDGVAVVPSVFYRYENVSFHVSEIGTRATGFSFRFNF